MILINILEHTFRDILICPVAVDSFFFTAFEDFTTYFLETWSYWSLSLVSNL